MQLTSIGKVLLAIIAIHSAAPLCAANDTSAQRILVEVWRGGDDGLTSRLGDALEEAFRKSNDFAPSYGQKPNTLIVTIPTNVDWKSRGNRDKVLSKIEFSWSGTDKILRVSKVACWDDMLTKCADKVVKDAKIATRRIRPPKSFHEKAG
jgi:hypothetical protein